MQQLLFYMIIEKSFYVDLMSEKIQQLIQKLHKNVHTILPNLSMILLYVVAVGFVIAPLLEAEFEFGGPSSDIEWEKGRDRWIGAPLAIGIELISVEYRESPTFLINCTAWARGDRLGEPIRLEMRHRTRTSGEFPPNAPKIGISSEVFGRDDRFPWDAYLVIIDFEVLDKFEMLSKEDIYIEISSTDPNWGISWLNVYLSSKLSVHFQINRRSLAILYEIIIPLIILSFLAATTFISTPLLELNDERKKNESDTTKKESEPQLAKERVTIAEKKKFRIDTAKWILLFGFANLLFAKYDLGFTVASRLALITVVICCVYYFSSLYQGRSSIGAWLTFDLGVVALALIAVLVYCSWLTAPWI